MRAPRRPRRALGAFTTLAAALIAFTLAAPSDRAMIVPLVGALVPGSYESVAGAPPPEMARAVTAVLAATLGVAPPPYLTLRVYGSRAALERGLVHDGGLSPLAASELSTSAIGVALPRTVMLLDDGVDGDRVRLLAHETMHVLQLELAGTGRPAQWLMEGSAEWAAFTVLERLGGAGVDERRRRAREVTRTYLAADAAFSPAGVQRPADFRRWQRAVGDLVAYQVAYTLANELADRAGARAFVVYFRALGEGTNHAAAFERAFALTPDAFIAAVRASLAGAASRAVIERG